MDRDMRRFRLTAAQAKRVDELTRRRFLLLTGAAALAGLVPACARDEQTLLPEQVAKEPLHYALMTEVAQKIKSRELSPLELAESMLTRIEAIDDRLKSFATVTRERAMEAALLAEQEIDSGIYRGPMHGIPVAVKDLCFTEGVRTMGGLSVYREFTPDHDGTAVARLDGAGAVLLGKLNLTEGAMAGYQEDFDIPVNPWDADYWSGASSSGSGVAVAAGLCFAALGTDTGGSIRLPSMANGVVGLKPSYGRVSRYGVHPLAETLDHVGPMTRSVADAAIVLETIAGPDVNDATTLDSQISGILQGIDSGIVGMKFGYDRAFASDGVDRGLVTAIDTALDVLESLGASIVEVEMPLDSETIGETWFAICSYEAFKAHAGTFPSRADEYGPYFREFLELGASITEEQYTAAMEARSAVSDAFANVLDSVDAVVCPSGGFTFPQSQEALYGDMTDLQPLFEQVQMQFTIPANFAGTPTLTVPCGFSKNFLPYTLQFMGPRLSEARLCRIGHAYEQATEWRKHHPAV